MAEVQPLVIPAAPPTSDKAAETGALGGGTDSASNAVACSAPFHAILKGDTHSTDFPDCLLGLFASPHAALLTGLRMHS